MDTLRCVVRVEAWQTPDHCVGSRLGEAANAEEAEDRARQRLMGDLSSNGQVHSRPQATSESAAPSPIKGTDHSSASQKSTSEEELTRTVGRPTEVQPSNEQSSIKSDVTEDQSRGQQQDADQPSETPSDPEDWSEELTAIDFELNRIGWARDQERIYLERAFGHAGRHRLTRYADLVSYLRQLRQLQPGDAPEQAVVPIRRGELITQGDLMLHQLGWSGEQARTFLQQHLGAKSRQQLSDEQLLQFNIILEESVHKIQTK